MFNILFTNIEFTHDNAKETRPDISMMHNNRCSYVVDNNNVKKAQHIFIDMV